MTAPTRRDVLASGVGLGAAALAACARAPGRSDDSEPLFRISLAQWSLHRALRAGELSHLDFPRAAREDFGIDAVEYVSTFFAGRGADSSEPRELERRAGDAGVRNLLVMVDGEGALADPDEAARLRAIENHLQWLAAAASLGCHSIRVNAAGSGERDEQLRRAADSLVRLAELAEPYGLSVLVENHGGLSSDGSWLAAVMRRADHPRVGTLPDFGNFDLGDGRRYDRYRGVEELMPFARAVSAKSHDFDEGGEEVHTDYRRMLGIVVEAGYRGYVGIEYEGSRLPEPEGVRATKRLLERVRDELG